MLFHPAGWHNVECSADGLDVGCRCSLTAFLHGNQVPWVDASLLCKRLPRVESACTQFCD